MLAKTIIRSAVLLGITVIFLYLTRRNEIEMGSVTGRSG